MSSRGLTRCVGPAGSRIKWVIYKLRLRCL